MNSCGRRIPPRRRRVPVSKMFRSALISHVGIAVEDLEAAIERYALITGDSSPVIEEVADQKVRVAIFTGRRSGEGADAEASWPKTVKASTISVSILRISRRNCLS